MVNKEHNWVLVNYPLRPGDKLPPEKRTVLCWVKESYLPFAGYLKFAAGDKNCPYFVVYHGNPDRGHSVVAWSDCFPHKAPEGIKSGVYTDGFEDKKNG